MAAKSRKVPHHSVYVIRLKEAVWAAEAFRRRNPMRVPGPPCAYVGMTGFDIDERFGQHRAGYKANKYARDHGVDLIRERCLRGLTYEGAQHEERRLADALRLEGWAVWQA